jgi:hypothetical protein
MLLTKPHSQLRRETEEAGTHKAAATAAAAATADRQRFCESAALFLERNGYFEALGVRGERGSGGSGKDMWLGMQFTCFTSTKGTETDLAEGAARRGARAQGADGGDLTPRCQYLCFCTSKASKLPVKQGEHT